MYTVGRILKQQREKLGASIEEVANALHVKARYIKALEENNLEVFRSTAHLKGLVKSYARLLGLDYQKLLPFLRRQIDDSVSLGPNKLTPIQVKTIQITYVHFLLLGLFLLLGFGIFMIIRSYLKSVKAPLLEIVEPKGTYVEVKEPKLTIKGVTEDRVRVTINGDEVPVNKDFTFEYTVSLVPGENKIIIKAEKTYVQGKETVKEIVAVYKKEGGGGEGAAVQPPPRPTATVQVAVLTNKAWILIRADNKQLDVGVKPAGYSKTFTAKEYFEVITGRPKDTQVKLNGKVLPWRTKDGKIYIKCVYNNDWQCE